MAEQIRLPSGERAMGAKPDHWQELETSNEGNVGMKVAIDPHLYRMIAETVGNMRTANIIDVGSGTNSLARDLLCRDPERYPALAMCGETLGTMRERVRKIIGYEANAEYIEFGRRETERLGVDDTRIEHVHLDVEKRHLPHSDKSVDLAVSRHFAMHLSASGFARHLRDVKRVLKEGRRYLMTVLSPDYERDKYKTEYPHRPPLAPGQQYDYPHGHPGSTHALTQYYRPVDYYLRDMNRAGLTVNSIQPLFGIVEGYRQTHRRYYSRTLPMGLMFDIGNVVPPSRKEWYTLNVEGGMMESKQARLKELIVRFSDTRKCGPDAAEMTALEQEAEFHALSTIYDSKYGPESNFSEEHRRKLDHPEIGEDFRDSLRWLDIREGAKVVNMGVNDGYELNVFNQLYPGRDILSTMRVFGVDVARQAIERAKEVYPRFQFIHGDGATLTGKNVNGGPDHVPDKWADLYMAITSFQSTSLKNKRDEAFDTAVRVLKAGTKGRMLFAIPNCYYRNDSELVQGRFDASRQQTDSMTALEETHYLCRKLEEAGFEVRVNGNYYIFIAGRRKG